MLTIAIALLALPAAQDCDSSPNHPFPGLQNPGFEESDPFITDPQHDYGSFWMGAEGQTRAPGGGNRFLELLPGQFAVQRAGALEGHTEGATLECSIDLPNVNSVAAVTFAERPYPLAKIKLGVNGWDNQSWLPPIATGFTGQEWFFAEEIAPGVRVELSGQAGENRTSADTSVGNGKGGTSFVETDRYPGLAVWTAPMDGVVRVMYRAMSNKDNDPTVIDFDFELESILAGSSSILANATILPGDQLGTLMTVEDLAVQQGDEIVFRCFANRTGFNQGKAKAFWSGLIEYRARRLTYYFRDPSHNFVPIEGPLDKAIVIDHPFGGFAPSTLNAGADFKTKFGGTPASAPLEVELTVPLGLGPARFDDVQLYVPFQSWSARDLREAVLDEGDELIGLQESGVIPGGDYGYRCQSFTMDGAASQSSLGALVSGLETLLQHRYNQAAFETHIAIHDAELRQPRTGAGFPFIQYDCNTGQLVDYAGGGGTFNGTAKLGALLQRYSRFGDVETLDQIRDIVAVVLMSPNILDSSYGTGQFAGVPMPIGHDFTTGLVPAATKQAYVDADGNALIKAVHPLLRFLAEARIVNERTGVERYSVQELDDWFGLCETALDAVIAHRGTDRKGYNGTFPSHHGAFQDFYGKSSTPTTHTWKIWDEYKPEFNASGTSGYTNWNTNLTIKKLRRRQPHTYSGDPTDLHSDVCNDGAEFYLPYWSQSTSLAGFHAGDQAGAWFSYLQLSNKFPVHLASYADQLQRTALHSVRHMHTLGVWTASPNDWHQTVAYGSNPANGGATSSGPSNAYIWGLGMALESLDAADPRRADYLAAAGSMFCRTRNYFKDGSCVPEWWPSVEIVEEPGDCTTKGAGVFAGWGWRTVDNFMFFLEELERDEVARPAVTISSPYFFDGTVNELTFDVVFPDAQADMATLMARVNDNLRIDCWADYGNGWEVRNVWPDQSAEFDPMVVNVPLNRVTLRLDTSSTALPQGAAYKLRVAARDALDRPVYETTIRE